MRVPAYLPAVPEARLSVSTIREDLDAVLRNDPATHSRLEALLAHSPLLAILIHRVAHRLFQRNHLRLLARMLATFARWATGVEIHPGAHVGRRFFIDHGTGVVIGETAEIGDDCVLFHNVTLGGTGKHEGKRHPTLGDRVFVGTGAILLGPIRVGDDVRIGANAFVHMRDVPPNTTVVGVPARIVKQDGQRVERELPPTESAGESVHLARFARLEAPSGR
jgi:serine O-acetyltransferase